MGEDLVALQADQLRDLGTHIGGIADSVRPPFEVMHAANNVIPGNFLESADLAQSLRVAADAMKQYNNGLGTTLGFNASFVTESAKRFGDLDHMSADGMSADGIRHHLAANVQPHVVQRPAVPAPPDQTGAPTPRAAGWLPTPERDLPPSDPFIDTGPTGPYI